MTSLLKKFLKRVDFDSYEDFEENFELKIPKNLNEMILLLVESEHKKVLVKLEKEFEEL